MDVASLSLLELEQLAASVRRELRERRPAGITCRRCGAKFAGRRDAIFCSSACRVSAHRAEKKEKESMAGVTGIGYEGLALEDLIRRLKTRQVSVLVDVRLNAISRKRGFSKKALGEALNAAGIRYVHLRALGNARDNREGYGLTDGLAAESARTLYRSTLDGEEARAALDELRTLAERERVAVFCYEADERHCHREQVLDRVMLADQQRSPSA